VKGGPFNDWTWMGLVQCTFARSEPRWRLLLHDVGWKYYDGKKLAHYAESETVFDGSTSLSITRDDRDVRNLPGLDLDSARALLTSSRGKIETQVSAEVDEKKPSAATSYATENQTNALYGYLPGDGLFVSDVLRKYISVVNVRLDSISDRPSYVLEAKTPHGTVSLWLDPGAEFAPIRLRVSKSPKDLFGGTPIQSLKGRGDKKRAAPALPLRGVEYQVDFRAAPVADKVGIVQYERLDRLIFEGGRDYSMRYAAEMTRVGFAPTSAELEPTLPIPENTRVYIQNAPGISAEWVGGKLTLHYDKPTVAALHANWFSESSSVTLWKRPLFILTAPLLVLFLASWGVYRCRRRLAR